MEPVEEGGVDHHVRKGRQQMARLDQPLDGRALLEVPHEHHRRGGRDRVAAPGEAPRGHVVLHDLHAARILEGDPRHLIEGDHIPEPDQPNLARREIHEQVGHRRLAARHQNCVGAHLLVDVALARALGAEFADVVVVLDQRDHPAEQVPADAGLELRGLVAGRPQEHVDPLLLGEFTPKREQLLHVEVRHLNRLDVFDDERRALLVLLVEILHRDNAPDAPDEQFLELLDELRADVGPPDVEVHEGGLVDVALLVQGDGDLVDDLVAAPLADQRLDLLPLVRADVVIGQNLLDLLEPLGDAGLVAGWAVAAEQVFEDEGGHVRPLLDDLGEVLADHLAGKAADQELVEPAGKRGVRSHR